MFYKIASGLVLIALAVQLPAAETINAFGLRWRVPVAADWKQFALADTPNYIAVTVDAEVYAWRDENHVQVFVDGQTSPSFEARDKSLTYGKVGLGSFFDTGAFRNVRIRGEVARDR